MRLTDLALYLCLGAAAFACGDNLQPGPATGDGDGDGDGDVSGPGLPEIERLSYPVIAHGGRLVITGRGLGEVTRVDIGGVAHTELAGVTDTTVVVPAVDDAVPTGAGQTLSVSAPDATSEPVSVSVIHLVISELDPDSPGADVAEFVELETGVAEPLSLDGYLLVHFDGTGATLAVIDLDAVTDAGGRMVVGSSALLAPPQIVYDDGFDQGEDAVAIYQFPQAPNVFPGDIAGAGTDRVIDAVVYESDADADAEALRPLVTDGVVIDEGATSAARETASIQRCPDDLGRRLGASYRLEIPTPGLANVNCDGVSALPDCTVDFDAECPGAAGACGAIFVAHGGAACDNNGVPECVSSGDALHSPAADNRVDIFLTGQIDDLQTFLAPFGGSNAQMRFFTLDGTEVGTPITELFDCDLASVSLSDGDLGAGAVRRIEVTGNGDLFIDDFRVNPAP